MRTEFRFNGEARLLLLPDNEDDKKLLELAFNGREPKLDHSEVGDTVTLRLVKTEVRLVKAEKADGKKA